MTITRHRFISCIGDDQDKYSEQKFLLNVPITDQSEVVQNPPASCVTHTLMLLHVCNLECHVILTLRLLDPSLSYTSSMDSLHMTKPILFSLTYLFLGREMNLSPL